MDSKSMSCICQVIFIICFSSIGIGATIATIRTSALRNANASWRYLVRNRTPTGSCFSGERAFTHYLATNRGTERFHPSQYTWYRSMTTQWKPTPWGNHANIINGSDRDPSGTQKSGDEDGTQQEATARSNGLSDNNGANNQPETQKPIDTGNIAVENKPPNALSEIQQTDVDDKHEEITSINDFEATTTRSETPKLVDVDIAEIQNVPTNDFIENEEARNTIDVPDRVENTVTVQLIEDGKMMNVNIIDDLTFKSHRTYVIQDNSEMQTTYYWIGEESSDKDAGEAAAQAVQLDAEARKRINVRKEAEGKESSIFKALFNHGVTKPVSKIQKKLTEASPKSIFLIEGKSESEFTFKRAVALNDTNELEESRCLVFADDKVYMYCGSVTNEKLLGTAERLARILMEKSGLNELELIHKNINSVDERPGEHSDLQAKDKLKELVSQYQNKLDEEQITREPYDFTPEEVRRILDQTRICESGYEQFNVEVLRIYGERGWRPTEWSVKDERSISQHVPILTLNSQDCYLTDSHSNVGLLVWLGKEAETSLRAESARKAELHVRRRKYDYATPITFIDQNDVPDEVETLEELVHVIEPVPVDDTSTLEEKLKVQDGTVKNKSDLDHSSSSSSTDDEN